VGEETAWESNTVYFETDEHGTEIFPTGFFSHVLGNFLFMHNMYTIYFWHFLLQMTVSFATSDILLLAAF
jgi:hypothetical protein